MLDTAKLEVNGNELQIIYTALDELPGKIGRALFTKLQAQVQQQLDADAQREREAAAKADADLRERHRAELLAEQCAQQPS
jgi:hypothetical protein